MYPVKEVGVKEHLPHIRYVIDKDEKFSIFQKNFFINIILCIMIYKYKGYKAKSHNINTLQMRVKIFYLIDFHYIDHKT